MGQIANGTIKILISILWWGRISDFPTMWGRKYRDYQIVTMITLALLAASALALNVTEIETPQTSYIRGIDVSHYQGTIDWLKVNSDQSVKSKCTHDYRLQMLVFSSHVRRQQKVNAFEIQNLNSAFVRHYLRGSNVFNQLGRNAFSRLLVCSA